MNGSFEEAQQRVSRLLEEVGGSANAYEEPMSPRPAAPTPTPSSGKPSWEEALRGTIASVEPTPEPEDQNEGNPFLSSDTPPHAEEEVTVGELIAEVAPDLDLEDFSDLGLQPIQDLGDVAMEIMQEDEELEDPCAGNQLAADVGIRPPIDERYYRAGIVENLGELNEVYKALTSAARGNNPGQVTLESGVYDVEARNEVYIIEDTGKGMQYMWENTHRMYHDVVEEDDHFIWVIRMGDEEDLGYILNGYVFMIRE